jgi:hypothetical protein
MRLDAARKNETLNNVAERRHVDTFKFTKKTCIPAAFMFAFSA